MKRLNALVLSAVVFCSCQSDKKFELLNADQTGIGFNNELLDSDSLNVLDIENIYNGGGVGIGDFNNDGLEDIYFTGNRVSNRLYINLGELRFQDITASSGTSGDGRWSRGVSVVDINNDGLPDLYVCASLSKIGLERENLLYINQGKDASGLPKFTNEAKAYGLADTSHSTMASFFDYDNDGDLDMYLLNNEIVKNEFTNNFRPPFVNAEHPGTDKLYRNEWNDSLGHPVFKDVSAEAGITIEGFGHGVSIADINADGWKDIYVTNDFLSQNLLYINQKNGRFKNEINQYLKHTSENSMGQDIVDINNDGLQDIIEVDMNPEDNSRKKMMMNPISYQRYVNNDYYQYQYQYVRNVLQLNQGPRILPGDSTGPPAFADISFHAGIAETDWSWTPSVADYDNDGYRDIIITNGFPKDVTDHDFMAFRQKASSLSSKKDILSQIPEVKIANYAYRNNGDLSFTNVTEDWNMNTPGFSNGAAYADFDNDGDLDLVINNINDPAYFYKNNSRERNSTSANFLKVKFIGGPKNRNGLGAWIEIHYNGKQQVYEHSPFRGYLSTVQSIAHFGLGEQKQLDSLIVHWGDTLRQVILNPAINSTVTVDLKNASPLEKNNFIAVKASSLFQDLTAASGINYNHEDRDFIDFNIQNLLPRKFSESGPALAVGDLNGDGLDDLVSGGSFFYTAQTFLQQKDGTFSQHGLANVEQETGKKGEDMGLLLFDADMDGDEDLYIARGGYEAAAGGEVYRDVFFLNTGQGRMVLDPVALPENLISKSCVRAADYDNDGDLDLFLAGRVEPGKYPSPVSSFIYRNDTREGAVKFTDVTKTVAPALINVGMICDAVYSDFDNDGWTDLILAGEWMPIKFLRNVSGKFEDVTAQSGNEALTGWWNSLAPGDFDNDGDMDYVVGNFGTNTLYKASEEYPVYITAKDFDENGSFDAIPSIYLPLSSKDPIKREFPVDLRDDMIKQMVSTRAKFQTYKDYSLATMENLLSPEQMSGAIRLKATEMKSFYLENNGKGSFSFKPLPVQAQLSVLNGMTVEDFNSDGNLDIAIAGNDYGTGLNVGRCDALNGLMLFGNGKGEFSVATILESGVYLPGNTKSLVALRGAAGKLMLAAAENKGPLKLLGLRNQQATFNVKPLDRYALISFSNGTTRRQEFHYGYSFLSQSARFIKSDIRVKSIKVTDSKGNTREILK